MKIKYISELTEEELADFKGSSVYKQSHADYRYCDVHFNYYKEYFGDAWKDLSLVVFEKKCFYICIYMLTNGKELSFFGSPLEIYVDSSLPTQNLNKAFTEIYSKLEELNKKLGGAFIRFYEEPHFLLKYYEHENFESHIVFENSIDLTKSEDEIFMCLRKSYKSLINWGKRNLELHIYDQSNMTDEIMCQFEEFHIQVSKRRTRSHESWMLQAESIKEGLGYIVFCNYEGKLVSATLVLNGESECYYGVCVNDRELMAQNLPIGHYGLYKSILIAKEKGLKKFNFGDVSDNADPKINAIVKYKRGFNNKMYIRHYITVKL